MIRISRFALFCFAGIFACCAAGFLQVRGPRSYLIAVGAVLGVLACLQFARAPLSASPPASSGMPAAG
jgi:hypothetical protein